MIRAATNADAAAIATIYAPFVTDSAISFEEAPPAVADIAGRIDGAIAWLVLELGGAIAGYAYARPFNPRAAYRWSVEISIYLAPAAQGAGHGTALTTTLLDQLTTRGYVSAIAGITLPNPASVGLFESLGFTPVASFPGVGHKHGAWHDVGYWQLRLREPTTPPPVLT